MNVSDITKEAASNGTASVEDSCGYYLYAIIDATPDAVTSALPTQGIAPMYPVYALPYRDVLAVLSKVSLDEFGEDALPVNLENTGWLAAKVHMHEGVMEAIAAEHTLIPMRFCTIFMSENRMTDTLADLYDKLVAALARLRGRREWGAKAYADADVLAQRARVTSEKVRRLDTGASDKQGGAAFFQRKLLGSAIDAETERLRDECAQNTYDHLADRAEIAVVKPLQAPECSGRQDEMIVNAAFLVADEGLPAFREALADIEQEYSDDGFTFEVTGPWPPYSFVEELLS